jgi:hypothetical protein
MALFRSISILLSRRAAELEIYKERSVVTVGSHYAEMRRCQIRLLAEFHHHSSYPHAKVPKA